MQKFTRSIIATACLLTSFGVLAHSGHNYKGDYKGEAMPLMPVTIPVLPGGFDFTLGGLYLKPTSSNLQYVSSSSTGVTTPSGVTVVTDDAEDVNPKYTWGFLLGLGYIFPGTANDVRVNWAHLHDNGNSDSSKFTAPVDGALTVFPIFNFFPIDIPLDSGNFVNASAEVDYDFDAVDLTFGQYINIGPRLQTRLFTGLRWARLDNELNANFSALRSLDEGERAFTASEGSDSTFHGIGPIFGVEANYDVGYNVGISGSFDVALLVGKLSLDQDASVNTFTDTGVFLGRTNTNFNYDSQRVVAPSWDARLGANYTYFMGNGSSFKFEIGYQASKYVDVIETADFNTTIPAETINFGLNGLYLSGMLRI